MTNEELHAKVQALAVAANRLSHDITQLLVYVEKTAPAVADDPVEAPAPKTDSVLQPGATITIEDVRAVLTKVSGKHGAAATKQLMGSHKKLSDVPHTQWADLIEKAEKLL